MRDSVGVGELGALGFSGPSGFTLLPSLEHDAKRAKLKGFLGGLINEHTSSVTRNAPIIAPGVKLAATYEIPLRMLRGPNIDEVDGSSIRGSALISRGDPSAVLAGLGTITGGYTINDFIPVGQSRGVSVSGNVATIAHNGDRLHLAVPSDSPVAAVFSVRIQRLFSANPSMNSDKVQTVTLQPGESADYSISGEGAVQTGPLNLVTDSRDFNTFVTLTDTPSARAVIDNTTKQQDLVNQIATINKQSDLTPGQRSTMVSSLEAQLSALQAQQATFGLGKPALIAIGIGAAALVGYFLFRKK